jgi:hypothetical protein
MNLEPGTQIVTADIAVGTSGSPTRVFSVELISGETASTLILKNGTSTGGTAYAQIDGVANQSVLYNYAGGKFFPAGCFADVDANISYAAITFTKNV